MDNGTSYQTNIYKYGQNPENLDNKSDAGKYTQAVEYYNKYGVPETFKEGQYGAVLSSFRQCAIDGHA